MWTPDVLLIVGFPIVLVIASLFWLFARPIQREQDDLNHEHDNIPYRVGFNRPDRQLHEACVDGDCREDCILPDGTPCILNRQVA